MSTYLYKHAHTQYPYDHLKETELDQQISRSMKLPHSSLSYQKRKAAKS
jgi:hypothetical protein